MFVQLAAMFVQDHWKHITWQKVWKIITKQTTYIVVQNFYNLTNVSKNSGDHKVGRA